MDDENLWAIYFAGIASILMHPRNNSDSRETIPFAARCADQMLDEHHKRWPVEKEEPCRG